MEKIGRHLRSAGYLICGLMLIASIFGAEGEATTFYVATTGNDANPGTEAAPVRTVNKGVKKLHPGDTLYVKSGTYAESLKNTIPGGTSWSSPVTVAAYPGHTVTLRPSAGTGNLLVFTGASKRYIVVKGFILDGVYANGNGIAMASGSPISNAPHHIRIMNCEVKNAHNHGILVNVGSEYNEFINLDVHDNGHNDLTHGVYIKASHNLVERSRIYRNAGYGVHVFWNNVEKVPVNYATIRNNKIYQNARVGQSGAGIILSSGTGHLAYNNLVWGNNQGIQVQYGNVSKAKVHNNTVYANQSHGIYIGKSASQTTVRNNIVYGNSGPEISNQGSGTLLSHNLVGVDPKFVNATAHDFRLQASSPAINTGVTLSEVPRDFAGVARPQGGSYDIGGYEYTGSSSSALVAAPMNLRIVDSQ